MMELTGKYLRLELSSAAMGNFFGKDPKPGPRWDLIGELGGETSGIGLWFHLIALGVNGVDPTWQPEARAVYLIRPPFGDRRIVPDTANTSVPWKESLQDYPSPGDCLGS